MRRHRIVLWAIVLAVGCLPSSVALGTEPGQQVMIAGWTDAPPVLDGVIGEGEYAAASPVYVSFEDPDTPPGIVTLGGLENPGDLSYTIYAMYDQDSLYIAVDVTDDIIFNDGPPYAEGVEVAYWDDCVELMIDGDQVGNDIQTGGGAGNSNKEGFQLQMDVGADRLTNARGYLEGAVPGFWEGASGRRPGGYVCEFAISLSWIDTQDGEGEVPPGPGSSVGLNVFIDDDDNGGDPYEQPEDEVGAWDGDRVAELYKQEDLYGTLIFAPPETVGVSSTPWGQIKATFQE